MNYYSFSDTYKRNNTNQQLKSAIWLYFFLLIFEGALRKWILPDLSNILLVVRDPIALWLVYKAWRNGMLRDNPYLIIMTLVAIISFLTTILFAHGNLFVALFGLRSLLIHFPLIFIIGKVFNREDVKKIGIVTLWIALPMVVLIALQFYSPQTAWVNRGVGNDIDGAGFGGALGYFRPPGTFSFTNGNVCFWGFVAAYLLFFWLESALGNKILLIAATIALFGAMSFSISRTLFFSIGLTLLFTMISVSRKPTFFWRIILILLIIFALTIILMQIPVFQTGLDAFTSRFNDANNSEGGLVNGVIGNRFFGSMLNAFSNVQDLPFWGYGLGISTSVGSTLIKNNQFALIDFEWLRTIGEMGVFLGGTVIAIRLFLAINLLKSSFLKIKEGNILPWLLTSFGFVYILQAQWAQPTSLGFIVLSGGLILASMKVKEKKKISIVENR